MPHYHIEKGVPLTDRQRSTGRSKNQDIIDLMLGMDVDDSFTFPANRRNSVESVMSMLKKQGRTEDKRWSVRKEDNVTVRVWRTE